MPDIREPYPIKPVWPSRPGRGVGDKKKPLVKREEEEKEKKKQQPTDNDRPHIDDYA